MGQTLAKTLVTSAAGLTGRRIVPALARFGADMRVFIRRKEARDELDALGAHDFAFGSLEDEAALAGAVKDCQTVLHICPPMHPQEDKIAASVVNVCKAAGVERLVFWSVLHPHIDVPHHWRKLDAEKYLIESGLGYTILQPSRYMQHLAPIWKHVQEDGVHSLPFSVDSLFSLVDLADLAEVTAAIVTQPGHEFATYELAGPEALSQADCAGILSGLLGKPVEAQARSLEDVRAQAEKAGMPGARIENMIAMNKHYDAHGLRGNGRVLQWLLGRDAHSFEDYVRRELMSG